ncbi:hypothetical protein [Aurantiacibacter spongiae]|uniref:Uncharacterized protein n=1 Tax=Aurantiacibacter spongiae TaxID=2488860 RepID=A0A3N5CMX6_9SPHN|nr:hypothetical protein [Aurantiacibacter spongiae]RPF70303.1 hypothetical protein EG799_00655 [Aurantiacibacter spongiae]
MKAALPVLAIVLLGAMPAPGKESDQRSPGVDRAPAQTQRSADAWGTEPPFEQERRCRDTIHTVQLERGQTPTFDRRPAEPDEALLYKAVDRDIDGCDVLVMANGDIRPVPLPQTGPLRQPAQ